MNTWRKLLQHTLQIILLIVLVGGSKDAAARSEKGKNILIISSYHESEVLSRSIISDVVRYGTAIEGVDVYSEYMNMWMVGDEEALGNFTQSLFAEYRDKKPNMVVLLGTSAFGLLRDDIQSEWGEIPMVLCAEEDFVAPRSAYLEKRYVPESERIPIEQLKDKYNATLVLSSVYLEQSVQLMQQMLPNMEELIFISDRRYTNYQCDHILSEVISERHPGLRYRNISAAHTSIEQLIDTLNTIDRERVGVLYSSWVYEQYMANNKILSTGAYRILAGFSAPLFTLRYAGMSDSNIVGGYLYKEEDYNHHVMDVLTELLNGGQARDIAPYLPQGRPTFKYPSLVMRGLSVDRCPAGTVFIDRPESFFDHYKWVIIGGFMLVILLLFTQQMRISVLNKIRSAQQREMESKAEYANLFNSMPILYMQEEVIFDNAGRPVETIYRNVNAQFEREFYPREEAVGRKGSELFPDSMPEFLRFIELTIRENKTVSFPFYYKPLDRFYDIVISRSYRSDLVDIFCMDCSELHRAQQMLSDTNHKLSMALEVANIVPWKWDLREHTILCDVNRALVLNGGGDLPQLAVPENAYFSKICKEDRERVEKAYKDLIEGRSDKVREEYRVLSTDTGHKHIDWVEAQAAVESTDESGRPTVLIGSSLVITERKRMESELTTAKDRAEESNRLKSAFLANMSHEIRTPLNAIVGFSGILASTEEPEEKQEYLSIIENNNALLLQLISDILDLSKIEAGTLEFIESDFDLNAFMREKEAMMRLRLTSDKVELSFVQSCDTCIVRTEKNRLSQVVINLLSNAIKFTSEGSIRFGYEMCGAMIRFYVTDTGTGIPADKQNTVFERFVKLDGFKQGTGLGLPICRTIVRHLGGDMGVESEVGKGSTFWFTLPFTPGQFRDKSNDEFVHKTVEKDKLTILIAEDNDSNYKLFETILKNEYRLVHAWDGRQAVELFKEHSPHIVLMDINMPEMNGYEATAEIRKISADVPIIAVTAFAYSSDEQQVMESGFNGYMAKPIQAGRLKAQILEILRTRMTLI